VTGTPSELQQDEAGSQGVPTPKLNTVGQALAILRFLADAAAPIGVNAISRELNFAPSSCFRILKQLAKEGYAQFDYRTKCYSLGSAAVMLARRSLDPSNTFSLILPSLTEFVSRTQASVGFWRRINEDRIVLAGFVESPNPMRIHMSIGQRLPLYIGAVGRAFAAEQGLSDAQIRSELGKLRWQVPPDSDHYCKQVQACRQSGYAIDKGNFAPGVTTVACVLRDTLGGLSFGLSAIRIAGQTDPDQIESLGEALVVLKQELGSTWLAQG
jgi:DNA-binding IclR family transcriptional regulator